MYTQQHKTQQNYVPIQFGYIIYKPVHFDWRHLGYKPPKGYTNPLIQEL